jgi:hypothetical protein
MNEKTYHARNLFAVLCNETGLVMLFGIPPLSKINNGKVCYYHPSAFIGFTHKLCFPYFKPNIIYQLNKPSFLYRIKKFLGLAK